MRELHPVIFNKENMPFLNVKSVRKVSYFVTVSPSFIGEIEYIIGKMNTVADSLSQENEEFTLNRPTQSAVNE